MSSALTDARNTGILEAQNGFRRDENRYGQVSPLHRKMSEEYLIGYDSVKRRPPPTPGYNKLGTAARAAAHSRAKAFYPFD